MTKSFNFGQKIGENNELRSDLLIVAGYGRNGRKKFWENGFRYYFPFPRGIRKKTKNDKKIQFGTKIIRK